MLGPTNKFFRGKPLSPNDRGGLYAGLAVMRQQRLIVMDFGTAVEFIAITAPEARMLAAALRKMSVENFGKLSYDITTLPLIVTTIKEKHIIEIKMPQVVTILAGNPEMWLALAERLDASASQLPDS